LHDSRFPRFPRRYDGGRRAVHQGYFLLQGFVENYNFLRSAIRVSKPYLIPYVRGQIARRGHSIIVREHLEGLIDAPSMCRLHFSDLNGLAVWMSFSSFFNRVDLQSVQAYYKQLFEKYL